MKSAQAKRMIHTAAILLWSAVILYFYASGRINKYLAPDFRILSFLGGLGLAVLGLFNVLTSYQDVSGCCADDHCCEPDDDDSNHGSGELHPLMTFVLMVVPVALSVAWSKDEYSASALSQKGLYDPVSMAGNKFLAAQMPVLTLEQIEKSHRKSDDGYYSFNLMELFFATGDREVQTLINGMKIETEGRWMDEKVRNEAGNRKRLYRLFMTCCAADSRAIPIVLDFGKLPPEYPENSWVKVSGTMHFPMEDGELHPVLTVERVLAADPPEEDSFQRKR